MKGLRGKCFMLPATSLDDLVYLLIDVESGLGVVSANNLHSGHIPWRKQLFTQLFGE